MTRSLLAILALGNTFLSGCGTFSDAMCGPINDHVYYRGVRLDVAAADEGGAKTFMLADIPFSAIADTLLVPYLAYHELTDPPRQSLHSPAPAPIQPVQSEGAPLSRASQKE